MTFKPAFAAASASGDVQKLEDETSPARTMRAGRQFREIVLGERFLPQTGPGAPRGPAGRRRRLGGPSGPPPMMLAPEL